MFLSEEAHENRPQWLRGRGATKTVPDGAVSQICRGSPVPVLEREELMFRQTLKMAWSSVKSNKMRSFLTMLGIIIGVVALVVLVSITTSATSQVTNIVNSMGTNTLSVSISDDKENPLKLAEMTDLLKLDKVAEVAPVASSSATVTNDETSETAQVTGSTADYADIEGKDLSAGRWLKSTDVTNHTCVCVINEDTASDIVGVTNTGDALGQTIKLSGIDYTVVGVLASETSTRMSNSSYEVYIPFSSLQRLSSSVSSVTSFVVSADNDDLDTAEASLTTWLLSRFENDSDAFTVTNSSTVKDTVSEITNTMSIMLGGIAAISLLVGGIGIMNIMLVSVTERTSEIGIRKAIGAGEGSILAQFLIEALLLSLIGCLIGVGLSYVILRITGLVNSTTYTMDMNVCYIATAFSLGIGLIFGYYPARKAARKEPIEALHYAG